MTDGQGGGAPTRYRYRLFGLILGSDTPFVSHLGPVGAGAPIDLHYACRTGPPPDLPAAPPAYESSYRTEEGAAALTVHGVEGGLALRFPGVADYRLERTTITAYLEPQGSPYAAELCLLGPVIALWLESASALVLHASSVVVGNRAIGFLAAPGGGKSSLAAEFLTAGHRLLGDDLLAVERGAGGWVARPGFPQIRLWPDSCRRLEPGWRRFERIHPDYEKRRVEIGEGGVGAWVSRPTRLAALIVSERSADTEAEIRLEPIPAQRRLIELVRHSFAARAVEALGLQPDRLDRLARLAVDVRLRRLTYPSGLDTLAEVRRRIERYLETGRDDDSPPTPAR